MKVWVLYYVGGNFHVKSVFSSMALALTYATSCPQDLAYTAGRPGSPLSDWNVGEYGAWCGDWQIDAFDVDSEVGATP